MAALLPCLAAFAQCEPQWLQGEPIGSLSGNVSDSVSWDPDGAGPAAPLLVVVGNISAGEVLDASIAAWNGSQWLRLGSPPAGDSYSAVVWNGNLVVAFDDGIDASVASWNGTSWQSLGTFSGSTGFGPYATLAVHQGNLFVATNCTQVGGATIPSVAQWTGTAWVGAGSGPLVPAMKLISFQNTLYAACRASTSLSGQLATWNGAAWTVVATCDRPISALAVRNGLSILNSFLYVGGSFSQWTGINGTVAGPIVRFSPSANAWTGLGFTASVGVAALAVRSTGQTTAEVVAAGNNGLWQQSGASWVQLGTPVANSTSASVTYYNAAWHLMTNLFSSPAQRLQAGSWVPLTPPAPTTPLGQVRAARAAGSDTIVGSSLGLWQGQPGNWSPLAGLAGSVDELARMANGDLVVAGVFTAPGLPANVRIARWNGVSWSPLATSVNGSTLALLPLPNGELLAGGNFTSIGGANIPYLARWTAGTWQPLGGGVNNTVRALTRLPNGDIVAGGDFTLAGTLTNTALYAARWDGAAWTAMSAPGPVTSLATEASGTVIAATSGVRRWNGSSWQLVVASSATAVLALPNGDLMASKFVSNGGLARIAPNGTVRTTYGIADGVTDLVLAEDGDILVAGNIQGVAGVASVGVARLDAPCPATSTTAGAGCTGSAGPLVLTPTALPWLGGTFRGVATGLPALAFGVGVTGFAPTSVPLLSLFPAAIAGCTLHAQPDLLEVVLATAGSVTVQLVVPNNPVLIGLVVQHQVVSLQSDAALNFTEVTATNSLQLTLGTL
ncbi:MAG: hypothetical protein RLZZ562_2280 [Planctomycetota bacterium]